MVQSAQSIQSFILPSFLPFRTSFLYWKDHGYYRNESRVGVSGIILLLFSLMMMRFFNSSLILNFDFDPAYPGQEAKPASAITMSKSLSFSEIRVVLDGEIFW